MSVSALDQIDTLASTLEALDDFRNVVGVDMTKAQLAILIVLAYSVDKPLLRDKEAKVVATGDPFHLDLLTEGHQNRIADLLALHSEGPSERLTADTAGKS